MRFAKALDAERCRDRGDPRQVPDRLVRAAVVALPVHGAGLSVQDDDLRTPLAASSEVAAIAERLEFTAGCGPSLAATGSGLPVFATEGVLARRWPIFHDLLVTVTPLRSVLGLPLPGRYHEIGAMELYFRDPAGPTGIGVVDARHLAGLVAQQLEAAADRLASTAAGVPSWLAGPAARRRGRLWTAVGMVMAAEHVAAKDALALLRGAAYATEHSVDDLADDLLDRRIDPHRLGGATVRAPIGRGTRKFRARPADGDAPARDGHVLLLHGTERERRAGLTAWVRRGLERGEKVVCTEPTDARAVRGEPLVAVLRAAGVDVAAAVRGGLLDVVPAELLGSPEGPRVLVERALDDGFPAVRLSVDAPAAGAVLTAAGFRDSERRIDELVRTRPVSAMCQYARSTTTGAELRDVVAVHVTGVHESTLATGGNGDALVLCGQVDAGNADVFAALLDSADRAASRELRLDLTGVTYLDAGAGRRVDDATRRFRAAGGRVRLIAPPPQVERALRLLGLGDLPGIELVAGTP